MILVTGATGFMGSKLVSKLVNEGYTVRAMVIENDPLLHKLDGVACEIVTGDITEPETLEEPLKGVKTVFHLAAVMVSNNKELFFKINYEGTKNIVEKSIEAGVEHFVYVSAAAANYRERTAYGEAKLKAEALMTNTRNTHFTIIRPTLLYGTEGGQEFMMYVKSIYKFPLVIPMVGLGSARKRFVLLDDVIDGLCKVVNKKITYNKLYNFSGGSDYTMWENTKIICRYLGIQKIMLPVPVPVCHMIAWGLKFFTKNPILKRDTILGVTMDANFSYQEAEEDIGYSPVTLEKGLAQSFPERKCNYLQN